MTEGCSYGCSLISTDRGRRIELSRTLDTPASRAWGFLTEVEYWSSWGPLLTNVQSPGKELRENTQGWITLCGVVRLPFEITSLNDSQWVWTVCGITPPADGHRVESLKNNRSRVSFELPLWAFGYLPVCALALRKLSLLADVKPKP